MDDIKSDLGIPNKITHIKERFKWFDHVAWKHNASNVKHTWMILSKEDSEEGYQNSGMT